MTKIKFEDFKVLYETDHFISFKLKGSYSLYEMIEIHELLLSKGYQLVDRDTNQHVEGMRIICRNLRSSSIVVKEEEENEDTT